MSLGKFCHLFLFFFLQSCLIWCAKFCCSLLIPNFVTCSCFSSFKVVWYDVLNFVVACWFQFWIPCFTCPTIFPLLQSSCFPTTLIWFAKFVAWVVQICHLVEFTCSFSPPLLLACFKVGPRVNEGSVCAKFDLSFTSMNLANLWWLLFFLPR